MSNYTSLPETGYVRLRQIIGNPKADPPVPAVIPVSKSTCWAGVKSGRYPQPVKLSPRTTAWRVEHIRALIERATSGCAMDGIETLQDSPNPDFSPRGEFRLKVLMVNIRKATPRINRFGTDAERR